MIRFSILTLFIILSFSAIGQNHFIGLTGGFNFTNANSSNFFDNKDSRHGYTGGLNYSFELNDKIEIGLDLIYSQQGFTNNVIFLDVSGEQTGEEASFSFNYDYFSFPIKCGFHKGDKLSGFVNFGLVPSVLIYAETFEPEIEGYSEELTTDITDKVNSFDLAGLIEIGGEYTIYERFSLFTSFIYTQSFTTISNEDYFEEASIKHYGMNISFGFKYALIK